jgi:signal transduction histidine kinase
MKNIRHERPLPHSMAINLAGWSARAHQYPVFSLTWFAYRMRSFRAPLIMLALVLLLVMMVAGVPKGVPDKVHFWSTFPAVWLVITLALGLGRGMAVLVVRRNWQPRREAAGIICALLIGVLAALALTPYTRTGGPRVQGRALTTQEIREAHDNRVLNLLIWLPVIVWLAGPLDLAAYFRQRGLLREAALQAQADHYKDQRNEVEAQLALLASQVEPHFLFNTLAGVRAAMLSDPERGVLMLDHLIDYLRSTIPQLRADRASKVVTLGSQLDAVQAYLGIVTARMPRLQVAIDCPPALRSAAIPPLMLISLVENAVKHGVEPKKGPALIRVTAAATADAVLTLTVADDGIGFAAASGSGIGLANIRERLQHLYGDAAALALRTGDAGGVVASIVLPTTGPGA